MQVILTEQEFEALKASRGIDREKIAPAGSELRKDLLDIARRFDFSPAQQDIVGLMSKAVKKFEAAISQV